MAEFEGFSVEEPDISDLSLGARKIVIWTDDPVSETAYLRLWVGDQELTDPDFDGTGMIIEGFVANAPAAPDTLQYQYPGEDRTDTGLIAQTEPEPGNT